MDDRRPTLAAPGAMRRQEALRAGVSEWALRGESFRQLFRDAYVPSTARVTPLLMASVALPLAPRGSAAARHTAARIWGGVVPDVADVQLVIPSGRRTRRDGICATERDDIDAVVQCGVPVTRPARTLLDLAPHLHLVDLVVLGDSLIRSGATTTEELVFAAARWSGRGARLARRAAAYVREGVDSPMETRLRMLLVLAGFAEPVVNHPVRDELSGRIVYRLDLAYPRLRLAIEYDGRQHAENTAQWTWDVRRREELDARDWRLVVVLAQDVYRDPDGLLDRVAGAVRTRGGLAPRRREEWRRYFAHHE